MHTHIYIYIRNKSMLSRRHVPTFIRSPSGPLRKHIQELFMFKRKHKHKHNKGWNTSPWQYTIFILYTNTHTHTHTHTHIYIYIYKVLCYWLTCLIYFWYSGTTLSKWPTWCTITLYKTFIIIILYMFRATLRSSSGGRIVLIQRLV